MCDHLSVMMQNAARGERGILFGQVRSPAWGVYQGNGKGSVGFYSWILRPASPFEGGFG